MIGAGGWGTALAASIAQEGQPTLLWTRQSAAADAIRARRENVRYLPGVPLPECLAVTADLQEVAAFSRYLILAVPSQAVRAVATELARFVTAEHRILNAAKGLEVDTSLRLSQVLCDVLPQVPIHAVATLSGPNHAEEVGRGIPSATVVAAQAREVADAWQDVLITPTLRVYTSSDQVGVELAGALKNIIALAAGISDGLGFGDNTKAALVTRGLAEIARLGVKLGALPLTFSGLAGLGDLMATCGSRHSRNRAVGEAVGSGKTLAAALAERGMAVEGVPTCQAAARLAHRLAVDMPITSAVYAVLFESFDPRAAVSALMSRGPKGELEAFLH